MKKISILIISMVLFLSGCMTSIPLEVTVPPELDYDGAEVVGVLPFGTPQFDAASTLRDEGFLYFWSYFFGSDITDEIRLANHLTSSIESMLVESDYFTVVSSRQLQKELEDGIVSVEAFITGKIVDFYEENDSGSKTRVDRDGYEYEAYWYSRKVTVEVVFQVMNADDYSIIDSYRARGSETDFVYDDWKDLRSYDSLARSALDDVLYSARSKFVPNTYTHYVTMEEMDNKKDPRIEKIDTFINNRFYEEAYDLYMEIYSETDDPKALYNAIILIEAMGDIHGALEKMKDLAKETGESKAFNQVRRMERAIANMEALENRE